MPSVEQVVYTTLVLSNATDQALLAGPVEVTVNEDFLLTAALPTLAPGGVCAGWGSDRPRPSASPAARVCTSRPRGCATTSPCSTTASTWKLANRLAVPVTVEVRERVPVTSDADVRIEERADWTAPEDGTEAEHHAPGTRLWRIELPSGGTAARDGGYEIRIPAGKALAGGNRRS
ncbi:hypothetical protein GCM10019016_135770 [Streptomyces prasinosporus]|uniref:DUF4139 domain-containing protein n=1 Tax=Streptomyces prasinosporus TaxID=68256 RepID=A0ABP6UFP3_9ACTN